MVNKISGKGVLEKYIKKELKKGFLLDKIKKTLIDAGYSKVLVENVIKTIKEEKEIPKIKPKKSYIVPLLVSLIILIVIVSGFLILMNIKAPEGIVEKKSTYEEIFEMACEQYNQNNKFICLAVATEDTSYCERILPMDYQINISFFSEADMKETCYNDVKISEALAKSPETMPDCSTFDDKGKSICLALKSGEVSNCENIIYDIEDEILFCKVIINRDIKYCELIDEQNKCPVVQ